MEKRKIITTGLSIFILFASFLPALTFAQPHKVEIWFFWGGGCPHCAAEKLFLEQLKQKYPQIEIKSFEVFQNGEYQKLFEEMAKAYETKPIGVPMTFVGKDYILGFDSDQTTGKEIEALVQKCLENSCLLPEEILKAGSIEKCEENRSEFRFSLFGKEFCLSTQKSLLFLGFVAGLADGINPCMFSVLLFLLTYLLAVGSRKRAIRVGLVFSLTAFVIYFLFMLGLINLIFLIGFIQKIKIIVAFVALAAGLIMVKDFFFYGKGLSLEIPEKTKPWLEKLIKRGTVPSAILLAILSSLVELPCTSGIPLVYVTILAERGTSAWFYLFWYNLFFILPLILIIAFVAFAWAQVDRIEKWRVAFRKYMRLAAGLILLFLALALLKGWL
ncbi:MAG TPA: hypothetical protein ENL33_00890 [Candidatus Parcubacteria bacterium]|nr:hypothetical protein [Candidatus Parcubacteria bacterium]